MGGDFIGSDLVRLSSGIDFVRAVVQVATGVEPDLTPVNEPGYAGVSFIFDEQDITVYNELCNEHPEYIVSSEMHEITGEVSDSSTRFGYYILTTKDQEELERYLPKELED